MAWIDGKNSVRNLLFTRENKATSKESIILNLGSYNYSSDFTSIVKHKDIPSTKFDQLSWIKRMTNSKGQEFSIDKKNSKELTTYSYIIEEIIK